MITGDRFLKILAFLIFVSFIIFAGIVTVRQIGATRDILLKTVEDNCFSTLIVGTDPGIPGEKAVAPIPDEATFLSSGYTCLFTGKDALSRSSLSRLLATHGFLDAADYLYLGDKGILIKRRETGQSHYINELYACLKSSSFTADNNYDPVMTVTLSYEAPDGTHPAAVTYTDIPLSRVCREGKRELSVMCKVKQLACDKLPLSLTLHGPYAQLETHDKKTIDHYVVPGHDGLFISARGAKLRLLPWESGNDPLDSLAKKGSQYGLASQEYEKNTSQLAVFRPFRFKERDGKMEPVAGYSFKDKDRYSNALMITYLTKWIIDNRNPSGCVTAVRSINDGKDIAKRHEIFSQVIGLEALFSAGYIPPSVQYLSHGRPLIACISGSIEKAPLPVQLAFFTAVKEYSLLSEVPENVLQPIEQRLFIANIGQTVASLPPEYKGIGIRAGLSLYFPGWQLPEQDKAVYLALIEDAMKEITALSDQNKKLLGLGYLLTPLALVENKRILDSILSTITENTNLARSFPDLYGGIPAGFHPEGVLTAEIARNAANYLRLNPGNPPLQLRELTDAFASFLRFMTVTPDDSVIWTSPSAKKVVMGGVRFSPGGSAVSLAATADALLFFEYMKTYSEYRQAFP